MNTDGILNQLHDILLVQNPDLTGIEDWDGFRFLDARAVDSVALTEFIIEVEEAFDIELTPSETESEGFRTLGGLARIIAAKRDDG